MIPKYILAFILLTQISCQNANTKIEISEKFDAKNILENQQAMENILTKDLIHQALNIPIENIKVTQEVNSFNKQPMFVLLSWPTGKTIPIANGKHELKEYYSIALGQIKKNNQADFDNDLSQSQDLQKMIDDMPNQKNYNKDIGLREATYLQTYSQQRTMKHITDIGQSAYWESPNHALHILVDSISFTIVANMGEDENAAKKAAFDVAKRILNP